MQAYQPSLDWIDAQKRAMETLLMQWAEINSGSLNIAGLAKQMDTLEAAFGALGGESSRITLEPFQSVNKLGEVEAKPLGQALSIRKRPEAPLQVFLCGHMDTVYGADHPFQHCKVIDGNTLNGPGVADLKGGLVVMLHALLAFEQSPFAEKLGWEILLNPDEEIGSPGSAPLFKDIAERHHLGLIYEPSHSDGALVSYRKGSGNFTVVIHGRAAHAGRDFDAGRNAIALMAKYICELYALNGQQKNVTINPGVIEGGKAVNIVPDLAIMKFNVRVGDDKEQHWVEEQLARLNEHFGKKQGFTLTMHGGFTRPPKTMNDDSQRLYSHLVDCAKKLGFDLALKPSGGVCDGNNLAAYGLPNLDTLGVRGGEIHSDREYVLLDSLTERAKLSALLLMRLASGDLPWPNKKGMP